MSYEEIHSSRDGLQISYAQERAVSAGADPATLKVAEVEDLPLACLPGNSLRTRVRVVGDIKADHPA